MQIIENREETGTTVIIDDNNFINCRLVKLEIHDSIAAVHQMRKELPMHHAASGE